MLYISAQELRITLLLLLPWKWLHCMGWLWEAGEWQIAYPKTVALLAWPGCSYSTWFSIQPAYSSKKIDGGNVIVVCLKLKRKSTNLHILNIDMWAIIYRSENNRKVLHAILHVKRRYSFLDIYLSTIVFLHSYFKQNLKKVMQHKHSIGWQWSTFSSDINSEGC